MIVGKEAVEWHVFNPVKHGFHCGIRRRYIIFFGGVTNPLAEHRPLYHLATADLIRQVSPHCINFQVMLHHVTLQKNY